MGVPQNPWVSILKWPNFGLFGVPKDVWWFYQCLRNRVCLKKWDTSPNFWHLSHFLNGDFRWFYDDESGVSFPLFVGQSRPLLQATQSWCRSRPGQLRKRGVSAMPPTKYTWLEANWVWANSQNYLCFRDKMGCFREFCEVESWSHFNFGATSCSVMISVSLRRSLSADQNRILGVWNPPRRVSSIPFTHWEIVAGPTFNNFCRIADHIDISKGKIW